MERVGNKAGLGAPARINQEPFAIVTGFDAAERSPGFPRAGAFRFRLRGSKINLSGLRLLAGKQNKTSEVFRLLAGKQNKTSEVFRCLPGSNSRAAAAKFISPACNFEADRF